MERDEPTHSQDSTHGASSSSASPHERDYEGGNKIPRGYDYEVFLSFRGIDTRNGFTDRLYSSLVAAGIHVFIDDDKLHVGEEIGPELLRGITQSKISISIISENYASSKWCLRELTHILKCKRTRGQRVLPIFYKVEPSQVRYLTGRFGDDINAHKEKLDENVVNEWEQALKDVSSLKGWESAKIHNGNEGALVKLVIREVMSELKRTSQLNLPHELVGIHDSVKVIMSWIDTKLEITKIIGIHGMGGIGKTTFAKVLYNNLSSRFEHLSFLMNIRETCARKGIESPQKQLIRDILGCPCDVSNVDEGVNVIKSRFPSKKVLIVLDDVDVGIHLRVLAGDGSWLKDGSIVIITTRNESILKEARANYIYQFKDLSLDQSLILFSRHAFQKDFPHSNYEDISREIVSTTGGLPLAIEVIGSFLCGMTEEVWEDTLKKLKKMPDKKVQEKLRISYDALGYEEQQMFLDIACFLIGSHEKSSTHMWDACEFFPKNGIARLRLLSLIKIDNGYLMMHDQLRNLGREIVRHENLREPQERSRLWNFEEAADVLDNSKGTRKIEALCLGNYGKGRRYTAEQFKEMTNLRFFQMNGANFTGDFQNLLPRLRWLQWEDCPSDFSATNFHPKKLVVLNLPRSKISKDWGGWGPLKMATGLKVLVLTHCSHLRRTPELSTFKSLEILSFECCWDLEEIHPSIGDVKILVSLNVARCYKLKELPAGVGRMEELRELILDHTIIREIPVLEGCLAKLETLSASHCEKLTQLPESLGSLVSLTRLDLSHSAIEELPESIGSLKKLETLDASNCKSLTGIPNSIGNLASLSRLNLKRCFKLAKLPASIDSLTSLTELHLTETAITELPESIARLQKSRILDLFRTKIAELPRDIGMLTELQELRVLDCKNMVGLPSSMGELISLNKLVLDGTGISRLSESICKLPCLQILSFRFCRKLQEVLELPSGSRDLGITCQNRPWPHLSQLTLLNKLTLSDCPWLVCLPDLPVGLSMLCITDCSKLKALTNLSKLEHLSELILKMCCELREVTGLEGLGSLSNLQVRHCPKICRFGAVKFSEAMRGLDADDVLLDSSKLTSAEVSRPEGSLHLSDPKILQSLDFSSLKRLRELHVTGCTNVTEIGGLDGLESLQILDISGCTSLGQSLDLSNLKKLQKFYARNCQNLHEIRGLKGSESLIDLGISGCTYLEQSPDLSNSQNLQTFDAECCKNLVRFRCLEGLESLVVLKVSGCSSIGPSLDLSNLKTPRELYAANCECLREIRGLDSLKSLRKLDVSECTSLEKSLNLSELKKLQVICAVNCKNLVQIRGIDRLESLKKLDVSGCISLKQSINVSDLRYLEELSAADCKNLVIIQGPNQSKQLKLDISGARPSNNH